MFCPKCGADAQSADSYCKRCGEWLPDIDALTRPRLFRKRTREEKIRKMRVLEAVSAGLSLTAAAIIISILAGGGDPQLLFQPAINEPKRFDKGRKGQQRYRCGHFDLRIRGRKTRCPPTTTESLNLLPTSP